MPTLAVSAYERIADGQLLQTLNAHEKSVNALAFSGDGCSLVSGGADKKLRLWQMAN